MLKNISMQMKKTLTTQLVEIFNFYTARYLYKTVFLPFALSTITSKKNLQSAIMG